MQNALTPILFIVVFGGVIIFVIISAIRRREISFVGLVIDKKITENTVNNNLNNPQQGTIMMGSNASVTHQYSVRVKTDQGKELNYAISSGMYETIKIGDRVSKPSGTTDISIISSQQPAAQTSIDNQQAAPTDQNHPNT